MLNKSDVWAVLCLGTMVGMRSMYSTEDDGGMSAAKSNDSA